MSKITLLTRNAAYFFITTTTKQQIQQKHGIELCQTSWDEQKSSQVEKQSWTPLTKESQITEH